MSEKAAFLTIAAIVVIVTFVTLINRFLYKNSIVSRLSFIVGLVIIICLVMGYCVGLLGFNHLLWIVPVIIVLSIGITYIMASFTQKPLDDMLSKVDALSKGNLDVTFDEKSKKDKTEISSMSRLLTKLTGSLNEIAQFADQIGKGNLDVKYELRGDQDRLGEVMLDMRSNLVESEKEKKLRDAEEYKRNWATVGLAKFAEILRQNNNDLTALSQDIIRHLLKYVQANQGGIFILNDENPKRPVLELQACYAYERKKFLQKTIEPGEGLVGTCFLERQSIYITEVPRDYIQITSGLGDDPPRALFLVPLKVNEEIYGIIEIASFKLLEPYEREFVEKVAESIAATISSVKTNIHTSQLLEISVKQADELARQEEELRQNMEEMQATQEEMRRREIELSDTLEQMEAIRKISEIKENEMNRLYDSIVASFDVVEFSPDGHIINVNQNVINSHYNATKETFIGRTLADVSQEPPEIIEEAFVQLRKGIPQEIIQDIIINGRGTKFNNKLVPMIGPDGELYKVILYAYKV